MADATIKRYLDELATQALINQIKSRDALAEQNAKEYADGLAVNYDAAGSAKTAEDNAKSHADTQVQALADGQVQLNKAAIEKLNGADTVDGSVAKSVKDAKDALQGNIDKVVEAVGKNTSDINDIKNEETGILKQATNYTDTAISNMQLAFDGLSEKVGELPEGTTATDIVDYVNIKTAGIATDAALGELNNQVSGLQTAVQDIQQDYLKAADKTALQESFDAAINALGVELGKADTSLGNRIKAIEDDYVKSADIEAAKQEVVASILGGEVNADFDTLKEVADWILSDTTGAAALQSDVAQLKIDVDAVEEAVEKAQEEVDDLELVVDGKVDKTVFDGAIESLGNADTSLGNRIKAIEDKFVEGEGSVSDMIADAVAGGVSEAVSTAAGDATTKANKALEDAKKYADEELGSRLDALEEIEHHTHTNKDELDLIASGDKAKWDEAAEKAHVHANEAELAKIADGDVAKWNNAEKNAKEYADGLNEATVNTINGRLQDTEDAVDGHTESITNINGAIENLQKEVSKNSSDLGLFRAIDPDDITAMFNVQA